MQFKPTPYTLPLKTLPLPTTTLWLYQPSLYEIHIINPAAPSPHRKICLENSQIQFYGVLEGGGKGYGVVVGGGTWVCYEIGVQNAGGNKNSGMVEVREVCEGVVECVDEVVVGVHLIQADKMMIIFVKDNGNLEYNYIRSPKMQTLKINKPYKTQPQNQKYQKSNLFSQYKGRQLLQPFSQSQSQPQNKIISSLYNLPTNQLYIVSEDINSKICSMWKFFLQGYQVIAGSDFLLNLEYRPVQIMMVGGIVLVNLGVEIVLWARNITQVERYADGGFCTSLTVVEKNKLLACVTKDSESIISLITLLPSKQEHTIATLEFQKIHTISTSLLHYMPLELPKPYPSISITNKLQVLHHDKLQSYKTLLPNLQTSILSARIFSKPFLNYFTLIKKVGHSLEHKIVTNNRIVTQVEEYQHNMLIKMGKLVWYGIGRVGNINGVELWVSSPVVGTLRFVVGYNREKEKEKDREEESVVISVGGMPANLSSQQQSLFLQLEQGQQITPTKLSLAKSRYSILDMFQGKIDFILNGWIVGNYALMAAERQVHIFTLEPKPKRLHIYCLDSELRMLVGLNDVNMWGAVFWDGSMQVLRIQEKQSVKVKQIEQIGYISNQNCLQFNSVINTAPYKETLIGTHLFIVSNDPLHVYQPQKTTVKVFPLPVQSIGEQYWPVIELPLVAQTKASPMQKFKILSKRDDMWCIVSFPTKCLVKEIEEIKMEVEMIIGFPSTQDLIAVIARDNMMTLFSGSRILNLVLQTGSITYKSLSTYQTSEKPQINYLNQWMKRQDIAVQNLTVENDNPILSTQPHLIRLSQSRIVLYNRKQIWYASIESSLNQNNVKLISYFSIPNDVFLQFRNNLSILQLQNEDFMEIFAQKLPILEVTKISESLLAVLYSKMIVVAQIKSNGAFSIKQELNFTQFPQIISIIQFLGSYDQNSLYLKDISNRLILLKFHKETKKYSLELLEQLQDEIVCLFKINGWKDSTRKINLKGQMTVEYQDVIVKKDGQLVVGREGKPIYL